MELEHIEEEVFDDEVSTKARARQVEESEGTSFIEGIFLIFVLKSTNNFPIHRQSILSMNGFLVLVLVDTQTDTWF